MERRKPQALTPPVCNAAQALRQGVSPPLKLMASNSPAKLVVHREEHISKPSPAGAFRISAVGSATIKGFQMCANAPRLVAVDALRTLRKEPFARCAGRRWRRACPALA